MLLLQGFNNRMARRNSYSGLASIDTLKDGCSTNENGSIDFVTMFNTSPVSSLFVIEVRLPFGFDHDSFACFIVCCDDGAGRFSALVAAKPLSSSKLPG